MDFKNFAEARIKNNGGRMTKTKAAVLDFLDQNEHFLSAYQIADQINQFEKKIDVATVYRVLESFLALGLVHKSEKGFVACSYHSCQSEEHCHHHFTCDGCEKSFEIHLNDQSFLKEVNQKFKDLMINGHSFNFSGLCKNCK